MHAYLGSVNNMALVRTYRPIMRNWQSLRGSQLPVCPLPANFRSTSAVTQHLALCCSCLLARRDCLHQQPECFLQALITLVRTSEVSQSHYDEIMRCNDHVRPTIFCAFVRQPSSTHFLLRPTGIACASAR